MTSGASVQRTPAASLVVTDEQLEALLELGRGGAPQAARLADLVAAGWVSRGAPAGVLAGGLVALTAPACALELQRGTYDGLWRVTPDDGALELYPTTPTAVFRELAALLPRAGEVAPAGA